MPEPGTDMAPGRRWWYVRRELVAVIAVQLAGVGAGVAAALAVGRAGPARAAGGAVAGVRPVLLLEPGRLLHHPALPRQPRCGTGSRQRVSAGRHRRGDVADVGVAAARIRPALVVGAWPAAVGRNPGRLHLAGTYHAGRRGPYRYRVRDLVRVPRPRSPARVGRNPFTHPAVVSAVRHRRDEHCRVIMSMTSGSGQPASQIPCSR